MKRLTAGPRRRRCRYHDRADHVDLAQRKHQSLMLRDFQFINDPIEGSNNTFTGS
jgi:hypothetical protein